jgi:hypothetical protein
MTRRLRALTWIAPLALMGCSAPKQPFPGLPRLSVSTQFRTENLCDLGVSPRIVLSQVPDGTAKYMVQITDTYVVLQNSWREVVPLMSKTEIPEGAAKTYVGPCIGDNSRFAPIAPYGYLHRVEVLAEAKDGRPLAYGATLVYVDSPYITAKKERLQSQQGGAPGANVFPTSPPPLSTYQGAFPGLNFPQGPGPSVGVLQ